MRKFASDFDPVKSPPKKQTSNGTLQKPSSPVPRLSTISLNPKVMIVRDRRLRIRGGDVTLIPFSSSAYENRARELDEGRNCRRTGSSGENRETNTRDSCVICVGRHRQSENSSNDRRETDSRGTCVDCTECRMRERNSSIESREANTRDSHVDCMDCTDCIDCEMQRKDTAKVSDATRSPVTSTELFGSDVDEGTDCSDRYEGDDEHVLVDLTEEDANITWKDAFFGRLRDSEDLAESRDAFEIANQSEESPNNLRDSRIMIADSSSRSRSTTGSSMATALRDRGPCVIPVQPNRSLPIRPAPPAPTRVSSLLKSRRDDRSPVLKLSKGTASSSGETNPSEQTNPLTITFTGREKEFDLDDGTRKKDSNAVFDARESANSIDTFVPPITTVLHFGGAKRKISDDREEERERLESSKKVRRRRRSHEADSSQKGERIEHILKEYSRIYSESAVAKNGKVSQQRASDHRNEKSWPGPMFASFTSECPTREPGVNKIVPPLRLKKVMIKDTHESVRHKDATSGAEKELNYRIVSTTASRSRPVTHSTTSVSSWTSSTIPTKSHESVMTASSATVHGDAKQTLSKGDNYKLKCRRNMLKRKLRELRGKASDLAQEMASTPKTGESSPQRNTRLRQMMNCYEKQMENLSKLLNKLSAVPSCDDVRDETNDLRGRPARNASAEEPDNDCARSLSPFSSLPSPEPPKLSPTGPIDYDESKLRDSPPVLLRVSLNIPPDAATNPQKASRNSTETVRAKSEEAARLNSVSLSALQYPSKTNSLAWRSTASDRTLEGPVDRNGLTSVDNERECFRHHKDAEVFDNATKSESSTTLLAREDGSKQCKSGDSLARVTDDDATNIGSDVVESEGRFRFQPLDGPIINSVVGGVETHRNPLGGGSIGRMEPKTTGQEVPVKTVKILQLQPNNGSSKAGDDPLSGDINQSLGHIRKMTSSFEHSDSVAKDVTSSFGQTSPSTNSTVNQQGTSTNSNIDEAMQDSSNQRDDNRIMTEQFPTLGNWLARLSKESATKSKVKVHSAVTALVAPNEDVVKATGPDVQKAATSNASNVPRNKVVNVIPQWNTERLQRQQHQQQRYQQQLLQQLAASAASSQPVISPTTRSGICQPLPVTQFFPNNYAAIDPYASTAYNYHPAVCAYTSYPYHPRLHPSAPLTGYQIPLQDGLNNPLRSLQHLDKCVPPLQDPLRHFGADVLKYPTPLAPGGFQPPSAIDFAFPRMTNTAHNGTANGCFPPLVVAPPPPPPVAPTSGQRPLSMSSPNGYSTSNGQFGRRVTPDVVAAAAAAAVVAAASFGRQRDALAPFSRQEPTAPGTVTGGVGGESSRLNLSGASGVSTGEHGASKQPQNHLTAENVPLNTAGYRQWQHLLLNDAPFVRNDANYGQSVVSGNRQGAVVTSSPYKLPPISSSFKEVKKEMWRNIIQRNCETPNLGKVNRALETFGNLKCSNCGLAGSTFKCLGCESAFYCNERCQVVHWNVHVERCPKKMPKLKKVT